LGTDRIRATAEESAALGVEIVVAAAIDNWLADVLDAPAAAAESAPA
jgi:hypothetical protein